MAWAPLPFLIRFPFFWLMIGARDSVVNPTVMSPERYNVDIQTPRPSSYFEHSPPSQRNIGKGGRLQGPGTPGFYDLLVVTSVAGPDYEADTADNWAVFPLSAPHASTKNVVAFATITEIFTKFTPVFGSEPHTLS